MNHLRGRAVRAAAPRIAVAMALTLAAGIASSAPPAGSVVYEIFVRSFQDSDGDGIGDLQGIIDRLDYLEWLGVTDLWLMPINPSPSYHGYDPTDYYSVDDDYGTLEDLDALVAKAGERGMRVILDLVVNHTSDRHPWFLASAAGDPRYRDYYLWSADRPDWQGLGAGSPWHARGQEHYLGLFSGMQPDLNFRNPNVRREMEEVARFWLERGVAGFRVDAIQHIVEGEDGAIRSTPETFEWVAEFEAFVKSVRPDAYLLGETWTGTPLIARYHGVSGLDMSTNYPFWEAVTAAVQSRSPGTLRAVLEQDERLYPQGAVRGPFISNHDQIRPATRFGFRRSDPARLRLAAALMLTSPGVPILYYGEEIGMPNGPGNDDRMKRTPMRWQAGGGAGFTAGTPWHPFSSEDAEVTVAAGLADDASLLNWYRRLIEIRQGSSALSTGSLELAQVDGRSLLAFLRRAERERILVVANLGTAEAEVDLAALGAAGAFDLLTESSVEAGTTIPASSVLILRLP